MCTYALEGPRIHMPVSVVMNADLCSQICVCKHVLVAQSCPTLCDPWTAAHQAPLSMRFSRQGYWSGLPLPSPGDLPNPRIKPRSPALQADSLLTKLQGKSVCKHGLIKKADSLEKTPILGRIEGNRRRGWQRMRWLVSITDLMDVSLSKLWETVNRGAWRAAVHGATKSQT